LSVGGGACTSTTGARNTFLFLSEENVIILNAPIMIFEALNNVE